MALSKKVLLIEELIHFTSETENIVDLLIINDALDILQTKVVSIEAIDDLLPHYLKNSTIAIGWFYSPLLYSLNYETIIYDCTDELSLFEGAPEHLINQDKKILAQADIIFTCGKSLYESNKFKHHNV